ncbi:MAG TPA: flagellar hook-length control protein FliK [Caldimonas sp.]|nr:flagellar hook-length control protein FliK [Caldimonas sp.]
MTTPAIQRAAPQAPAPHPSLESTEPAAHPFAELLKQNRDAVAASPPADAPREAPRTAVRAPDAAGDDAACARPVAQPPVSSAAPPAPAPEADDASGAPPAEDNTTPDAARSRPSPARTRLRAGPSVAVADAEGRTEGPRASHADRRTTDRAAPAAGDPTAALATSARAIPATALNDGSAGSADDAATGRAIAAEPGGSGRDVRSAHAVDAKVLESRVADPRIDGVASGTAAIANRGDNHATSTDGATATGGAMPPAAPSFTGPPAAPAAVDASVATPVAAPDFAHAFAVQVSVLATEGVQRAELHLNPAELGPVSVHIALDGAQARVDFGADAAATRHAIEAGLPELASALRDAGFTLAGGGVASHAGGQAREDGARDGAAARARSPTANVIEATGTLQRRILRAGGIDLYA